MVQQVLDPVKMLPGSFCGGVWGSLEGLQCCRWLLFNLKVSLERVSGRLVFFVGFLFLLKDDKLSTEFTTTFPRLPKGSV